MRKTIFSLLILGLALPVASESTRVWRQSDFSDFGKGTLEGIALRSDGELSLAPALTEFADPELEFVWTVAEDRKGTVYVGGGSPARVLSVAKDGTVSTLFESEELEVHALAVDEKSGTLYAATSPDGKIYRITRDGASEELFDPEAKYIWALTRDSAGNLYAATGDKGTIFRITPDGKGDIFFQSEETHIRSLAIGPDNQIYAGTEPSGLIYRITASGEAFVLYETDNKEVTSLTVDTEGTLYAASIGSKRPQTGMPGATPPGAGSNSAVTAAAMAAQLTAQAIVSTLRIPFLTAGGSDVYKIAADGFPSLLWNSRGQLVYALAFDGSGRLLAGSGNKGKLFAIDSPILYSDIAKVASQQVTAVHRTRDGAVLFATANPGMLYRLGPELSKEGVIESDVFDAELYTNWGRISWRGRGTNNGDNGGDGVTLYTRSGNTSDSSSHWSQWSEAYGDAAGTVVTSPPARFIQWKAVLTGKSGHQPSLSAVEVAYLRRNLSPTVEAIVVQQPGIGVREMPMGNQSFTPAQLELPPPPARSARGARGARRAGGAIISSPARSMQRPQAPPQGAADATARSVLWTADDPNDDSLAFTVYYRGEDEKEWKMMAENISASYYTWERTTLPDGVYLLKVVASDAPSNPADVALHSENISDHFEVDNTAPTIAGLQTASNSATTVRFAASDSFSKLDKAEYSLDADEWKLVFPTTRTTDARDHSYEFEIGNLPKGEHSMVVRVYDAFGNIALARTTFIVK